ncbi:MAG: hypothetical protein AAFQ98_18130 [Bacteroidota bacterium]
MRKFLFIGITSLCLFNQQAVAQEYVFKILANKGNNAYRTSEAGADWQPLRTGASLSEGYEVQIAEGAYVGLIHASGKTHELTTPGSYDVDDLASTLTSGSTGVAAKYADFVLTKLNEEEVDINANYGQFVNATGAVERATNSSKLKLMLNKSTKVYGSEVILRWAEGDESESYLITLYNIFDKVIQEQEVEESSMMLNFDDEMMQGQHFVKITVQVMGSDSLISDQYGIERLPPGRIQSISDEWMTLQGEVQEETPLNYIVKAGFFEEKGLLLDALTAYEKAIRLAPDVDSFRELYQEFLVRSKLAGETEGESSEN